MVAPSSSRHIPARIRKLGYTILVNGLVFAFLFGGLEIAYRIHREGVSRAFGNLFSFVRSGDPKNERWVVNDPELGYRLNPGNPAYNQRSVRGGEIAVPKPAGVHRIVYLGDSITFPDPGFVSYTREEIVKQGAFEVINAGVPGYTAFQEVLFYKKFLAPTAPDLVIWVYCLNDNHRFLHRFDREGNMLWAREAEAPGNMNPLWGFLIRHSYVLRRIHFGMAGKAMNSGQRYEWEGNIAFDSAWKDESWPEYEAQLKELSRILLAQGAKLAIIVVPFEPQLAHARDIEALAYVTKPQRKVASLCEKYGIPCLDLYAPFAAESAQGRKLYEDGIHLTPEGHRLASGQILPFLAERNLLTSK